MSGTVDGYDARRGIYGLKLSGLDYHLVLNAVRLTAFISPYTQSLGGTLTAFIS